MRLGLGEALKGALGAARPEEPVMDLGDGGVFGAGSRVDLMQKAKADPAAMMELASPFVRTAYSDLDPTTAYSLDKVAESKRRKLDAQKVYENAQKGIGVEEGHRMMVEEQLGPSLRGPAQDSWLEEGYAEFLKSGPVRFGSGDVEDFGGGMPDGEAAGGGVRRPWFGAPVGGDAAGGAESAVRGTEESQGLPSVREFGEFVQFMHGRPRPPGVVGLEDPSLISVAATLLLASRAPARYKAEILAMPARYKEWERANAQKRRDLEWQWALEGQQAEAEARMKMAEIAHADKRAADAGALAREEIASRERIAGAASDDRMRTANEGLQQKYRDTVARMLGNANTPPASLRSFMSQATGLDGQYLYSDDEIAAAVKQLEESRKSRLDLQGAQAYKATKGGDYDAQRKLTEEQRTRQEAVEAKVAEATVAEQIDLVKKSAAVKGLEFQMDGERLKELQFVVQNLKDDHAKRMAYLVAQTGHLNALTAHVGDGGGLSDRERYDGMNALSDARDALRDLKSERRGLLDDNEGALTKWRQAEAYLAAHPNGDDERTAEELRSGVAYYLSEAQRIGEVLRGYDREIGEAEQAVSDARTALAPPEREEKIGPVKVVLDKLTGPITGAVGRALGGGRK